MKNLLKLSLVFITVFIVGETYAQSDYAILAHRDICTNAKWKKFLKEVTNRYDAKVIGFGGSVMESKPELQKLNPRYVLVVQKPELINQKFVSEVNKLSRTIDQDVYADFIWGLIPAIDVDMARKVMNASKESLTIRRPMLLTPHEVKNMRGVDTLIVMDPSTAAFTKEDGQIIANVNFTIRTNSKDTLVWNLSPIKNTVQEFGKLMAKYNPDLLLGGSSEIGGFRPHTTDLMSCIRSRNGHFYVSHFNGPESEMSDIAGRRLYLEFGQPVFVANQKPEDNMMKSWFQSGGAAGIAAYMSRNWHGQGCWGMWKLWVATPGRYTAPEAFYLNQQYIISMLNDWSPKFNDAVYPNMESGVDGYAAANDEMCKHTGLLTLNHNQVGCLYDRDAFVYFGDPKWNVRLSKDSEKPQYTVNSEVKGSTCVITITTAADFDMDKITGDFFLEKSDVHRFGTINVLPFTYLFPKRLNGTPKVVNSDDVEGRIEISDDFLFIHDFYFEPNKTYKITVSLN